MSLRAAFDVSKCSPHGITTVAGYIAPADQWKAVEERWNKQLGHAGLEAFHLAEIKRQYGTHWLDIVRPFAQIVRDVGLRSATAMLKDTDWAVADHDAAYRKICPHREHACLDLIFGVVADDVRLEFENQPVALVFDNDYGNHKAVVRVHSAWCQRTGHAGFNIYRKGEMAWDSVPLQCADMVAGLLRVNPFSHALLNDDLRSIDDNDPVAEVAHTTLSAGRGAMWSAPIAIKVEALLRRKGD